MNASLRLARVGVAALALALLTPRPARADCAEGAFYGASVTGNTVSMCTMGTVTCTPSTPFLRQDAASGAVVSIAATCDMSGCFNDDCVPPGKYRYGLATAFTCSDKGCGSDVPYFEEVTVTAALSNCTRDASSPAPAPTTEAPPWGSGSSVTATLSCPGGCACGTVGSDRGKALAVQALVAAAGLCAMLTRRRRPRK